ncbi:hypothetical protein ACHAXH_006096 [Discostella pseudostelligera]
MEEVGKGARLVFRYPASPPPYFLPTPPSSDDGIKDPLDNGAENHNLRGNKSPNTSPTKKSEHNTTSSSTSDSTHGTSGSIDLFFDLTARVFSKLFRPKRPLCGQPLTLNVSGTTFCCRAELFDSQPSTIGEGSNHPLVLFSVVVALAPLASSVIKENQPPNLMQQPLFPSNVDCTNAHQSDDTFSTIQCVHRNLARLCRVFKREEFRCRYVSRQCNMLLQIRKEYETRVGQDNASHSSGSDNVVGANSPAAGVDVNPKICDTSGPSSALSSMEKRISIPPSTTTNVNLKDSTNTKVGNATSRPEMTRAQRREHAQTLIEIMLATSPPIQNNNPIGDEYDGKDQHGNLARELASVFHLLSSPSPSILSNATSHEGVVYINRHIAVPLDSANNHFMASSHSYSSSMKHHPKQQHCIQPYHTLLFPTSTPSEVIESLLDETINGNEMTTSSSISQCLQRMLPHVQPNKSIHEIAWESALSLPHVMAAASWLVRTGLCMAAMPVLRKNRYVCADGVVARMTTMALPFWQTFGVRSRNCMFFWGEKASSNSAPRNDDSVDDARQRKTTRIGTAGAPHVFVLVSALTTKVNDRSDIDQSGNRPALPTLGKTIHLLSGYDDPIPEVSTHYTRSYSQQNGEIRQQNTATSGAYYDCTETEEIIYSMAVWLIANNIIVQANEYLVTGEVTAEFINNGGSDQSTSEESLYQVLYQGGYLDGTNHIPAICYELGVDQVRIEKLIVWGQKTRRLNVVFRP